MFAPWIALVLAAVYVVAGIVAIRNRNRPEIEARALAVALPLAAVSAVHYAMAAAWLSAVLIAGVAVVDAVFLIRARRRAYARELEQIRNR
ncbi:hypothetical protein O7626_41070 [Micromonospora sp. WMMD1102]|uniref:hypothetical protein n=1 Tax=Micromonospora sp. WMMD1102 TaxID=3016105 RepID=UPI00241541D3|nr:hypothetical protein [Micromonospora sp. WMMD1102]MDG4784379.1 hypothetical protein [Micromonospora sp. WMMD1102]MDG4792197.1 hypothetical protein [Micromonospora sp. WMMD1102]